MDTEGAGDNNAMLANGPANAMASSRRGRARPSGASGKLEATLSNYQQRWDHYQTALQVFERRFEIDSETFYQRFEAGALGDDTDFFEWAGLYELSQHLLPQIHRLEQAL